MGYLPALGGKAAHLVNDLATVILNPVSERERQPHHPTHLPEATEGEDTLFVDDDSDQNSDGPDTSSFRAFLMSFVPSSTASKNSMETIPEHNLDVEYPTLTPVGKACSGRKGLFSRGKHSLGRIISKAGLGNLRQKQTHSIDGEIIGQTESVAPRFEVKGSKESTLHDKLPAMSEPSLLLTEMMRAVLYTSLPVLVQGRNWMLVYSTWRHGISLSTLYRRSRLCAGYSLLVFLFTAIHMIICCLLLQIVGDRRGAVFGGLVEAPLQPIVKRKYQGTNDCFVFTNVDGCPVICHPTGANNYFTFCSTDYMAMGGGGHFALYLDGDLMTGSSSTSETFNNPCLSHTQEFKIKDVELWGFVNASKFEEMLMICRTEKQGIWNL
ncbi:TLD-domain containing nucleolar protein [Zea mays]|uniref:TLD-domain containing nucleolar protein n=1 Tax=Zea mays TaxID=4577 RepID=A0A1D6NRW9_MAIZE|nr:TLD-domain containing nucleolar protein [Zea mays]